LGHYKQLLVYQKAYALAIKIFHVTKEFPLDEKYSLTDQVRRSSRSVCTNMAEAYKRRKYRNHFLSKLSDCASENVETEVWLDFSKDCQYLDINLHRELVELNSEIGRMITYMINNPEKFS
jgi:four helix bundle protein